MPTFNHRDKLQTAKNRKCISTILLLLLFTISCQKQEKIKPIEEFPVFSHHSVKELGDLDLIKTRGTLRVLLINDLSSYFLWRGKLMGFEYELLKLFAKEHNLHLSVTVVPDHKSLIPMLVRGEGDIAAGFLVATPARLKQGAVFSRRYHSGHEILVSHKTETITNLKQLKGRSIDVRRSSSYWQSAKSLKKQGVTLSIKAVKENINTLDLLDSIGANPKKLTIADSHLVELNQTWNDNIHSHLTIGQEQNHGWAVRSSNPELLKKINAFHKKYYRGLKYNLLYKKYFKHKKHIKTHIKEYRSNTNRLSPYDELIKPLAKQANIDWRLITAQVYQESLFNPKATSWAGAEGLLQVMPKTGLEMGYTNLKDPAISLKAGIEYLQWTRERFAKDLPIDTRKWFALAAYNAGISHVRDAQRLAVEQGLDPQRWFSHVEKAMLLLEKPEYYQLARSGYVRGSEPVNYVREIRERYRAYVSLIEK